MARAHAIVEIFWRRQNQQLRTMDPKNHIPRIHGILTQHDPQSRHRAGLYYVQTLCGPMSRSVAKHAKGAAEVLAQLERHVNPPDAVEGPRRRRRRRRAFDDDNNNNNTAVDWAWWITVMLVVLFVLAFAIRATGAVGRRFVGWMVGRWFEDTPAVVDLPPAPTDLYAPCIRNARSPQSCHS
ncbi:hypothetical protein IWZ03DRAFT_391210 [Phyllosticta citriasiana]|uniref:Uncharacterized protein n=1 Tax=Phyllosticta citriasiana TaxID=595635 RepID=A0ABR1KCG2_9PEZI